jgi:hypothetical protein
MPTNDLISLKLTFASMTAAIEALYVVNFLLETGLILAVLTCLIIY